MTAGRKAKYKNPKKILITLEKEDLEAFDKLAFEFSNSRNEYIEKLIKKVIARGRSN